MTHPLMQQLESAQCVSPDRLEPFFPRVRDRDDIAVLMDPVTEVIVLSRFDHIDMEYYNERAETEGYKVWDGVIKPPKLEDNSRRRAEFGRYIKGKRWLDFGSGLGGMLDEMSGYADWAVGLEPNEERASICRSKGHEIVASLDMIEDGTLDCITLFHVFEHLTDPIGTVQHLMDKLRPGGTLICEVPHARDALIHTYDCLAFKKATFWSEHLVLHTRQSLASLLKSAGFPEVEVNALQRYPLANHLHWLATGKPGGQAQWSYLTSSALDREYEATLSKLDRTDTIFAICKAPNTPAG